MSYTPQNRRRCWPEPWTTQVSAAMPVLQEEVAFDAIILGVLNIHNPQLDELWWTHGWPEPEIVSWCQIGHQRDRLFRAALRAGIAVGEPQRAESESPLSKNQHALVLALADSSTPDRWWWLMLRRRSGTFTELEQRTASLWLRHWQMRFALPAEPGLHRLLLGHDWRLLAADLGTQAALLRDNHRLDELLAGLPAILQQRYPDLTDQCPCDLVLSIAGSPWWIRLSRNRLLHATPSMHWYLELRAIDADDMPPLGLVRDDRIARSIAFIHQHFVQAPGLNDVARAVHISPFHFHRLFTRLIGISPKHYVQKKQLQMAKWFLRRGGVPIGQVAALAGFSSHGHFTSTFHRVVGVAPSAYRDQAASDKLDTLTGSFVCAAQPDTLRP